MNHGENTMKKNLLLSLGENLVVMFWNTESVKLFLIELLTKYVKTTDNRVDDELVALVREKLLPTKPM